MHDEAQRRAYQKALDRMENKVRNEEIDRLRAENERLRGIVERLLEEARPKVSRPCDCDHCGCGNMDDYAAVRAWDADQRQYERMQAITREAAERAGEDA